MARGGFLRRIGRAIKNVVAPPPPRPAPPPEPPKQPPAGRDPYKRVWRSEGGKGSYQRNLAVFHSVIDPVESDPDEQLELWESYVRNINRGKGRFRRQDTANMFWRDSGIDPSDFNWQAWRQAMGYTGKNRSKTS